MNHGKYVFAQICSFLPQRAFDTIVSRYSGDYRVRHFTCWNQMLCVSSRNSLSLKAIRMKEKSPKKKKANLLSCVPYKRRKESEMIKIVREAHSGMIAKRAACVKYGLNRNTLALFIRRFSVRNLINELPNQN